MRRRLDARAKALPITVIALLGAAVFAGVVSHNEPASPIGPASPVATPTEHAQASGMPPAVVEKAVSRASGTPDLVLQHAVHAEALVVVSPAELQNMRARTHVTGIIQWISVGPTGISQFALTVDDRSALRLGTLIVGITDATRFLSVEQKATLRVGDRIDVELEGHVMESAPARASARRIVFGTP